MAKRQRNYEVDKVKVDELKLYADNNYKFYQQFKSPYDKSLQKKYDKGVYDKQKAIKGYERGATIVAKNYSKEFDTVKLNPAERKLLATELEEDSFEEIKLGNYRV